MICPPCAETTDAIAAAVRDGDLDENTGHYAEICRDHAITPHGCACQHGQTEEATR